MPITVKNSAGGGVTLDSSTSSNETINLNTPVFTGNVGVGSSLLTTTASNMLQIGSTSNLSWYNQGDDELDINVNAVNNSGNKYIEAKAASQYIQHAGIHYFNVAASGSAGATITWNTGLEVLATGKARAKNGLLFGTDTAASNALDDYEEGTWSMVIKGSTGSTGSWAQAGVQASYTKIGRVVHFSGTGYVSNKGSYSGQLQVQGLPFASGNTNGNTAVSASAIPVAAFGNAVYIPQVLANSSACQIRKGNYLDATAQWSELVVNIRLNISGFYTTA